MTMRKPVAPDIIPVDLWEILVPAEDNKGYHIEKQYHQQWDAKVRAITGGLTIMPVSKGQWLDPDNVLFREHMIPVRFACSAANIQKIVDITMDHYDQKAVMAYRISSQCLIKYRTIPPTHGVTDAANARDDASRVKHQPRSGEPHGE